MIQLKTLDFCKDNALKLIKAWEGASEKWNNFGDWVDRQAETDAKITQVSVIKALIIEASDIRLQDTAGKEIKAECDNFHKHTIKKVMDRLTAAERQLVDKKYNSIKSLISLARRDNKHPGEGTPDQGKGKKPKPRKLVLSGMTFKENESKLSTFLHELSIADIEAVRQMVELVYNVKIEEHKKAS